jgi:hypothetical protein
MFFSARLGSPQSALGSIRLGEPDCAFGSDSLALSANETAGTLNAIAAFTSRLGWQRSKLSFVRLGEPDIDLAGTEASDTAALDLAESLFLEITAELADTLSITFAEDGAGQQAAAFFTGRLGWRRSKLSFVRLGEPDTAYLLASLQVGLGEGAAASILPLASADELAISLSEIANQSLATAPGPALVDQAAVELVFSAATPSALLDQLAREAIYTTVPSALLDQLVVELIFKRGVGSAYVSGSVPNNITAFVY